MIGESEFRAALREWGPLLDLLLQPSNLSPVGSASHWLRSGAFSSSTFPASRLWRLVPHLLASRVAIGHPHSFDNPHTQQEKSEEDEQSRPRKRSRTTIGNSMWMQTLPSMAQANILGFLDAEHTLFHAKDLKTLALDLLSCGRLNLWVARAAQNLLNKMGCSNNINQEELLGCHALPSCLLIHKTQPPVLPWMPVALPLQKTTAKPTSQVKVNLCLDNSKQLQGGAIPILDVSKNEGNCHANEKIPQEQDTESCIRTPPHSEGCNRSSEEWCLSTAVLSAQDEEKMSMISSKSMKGVQDEPKHFEEEVSSVSALAISLREAWLERQPTLDDLCKLNTSLDASMFFKILKPWEMKDDTVLNMIKVFLRKDSGFAWSAQILSYCLLPKLILLDQPASRFLVSAVIEACKAHPRAVIDALLVPMVLSDGGLTTAQCDVLNRVLNECLSDNHVFSLCGKIVVSNRRQGLPFPLPPFVRESFVSTTVMWSEPAWTLLQNAISRPIELDIELLEGLVNVCGEEVVKFAKSLKFCNLLLCLLSKYGPCLKAFKSKIQRISEQTETFMTKALIAKSSGL